MDTNKENIERIPGKNSGESAGGKQGRMPLFNYLHYNAFSKFIRKYLKGKIIEKIYYRQFVLKNY